MNTRRLLSTTLAILTLAALGWLAAGRPGLEGSNATAGETQTWTHPHVIDGDTIEAANPEDEVERIRILGIIH